MSGFDTAGLHDLIPYAALLDLQVERAEPDGVVLTMAFRPDLCTSATMMHGGALMSLADTSGAVLAVLNLPEGSGGTTTLESKTNLLGAVRGDVVTATSSLLHAGRSVIVVETVLTAGEKTVAKTTQTQMVLQPRA
ncbi:MAG: hypothetical protein QOF76_5538 [Solirubrobacteraceae bacterium]|jgi:uncharacterized protein (TIGR00369 family)|nr:hypothetical protein [Solirubrobacteraceae bacterium]